MSRQIGEIPTRTFNPGDVIFREGDDAKGEAFFVHIGKVEIRKVMGGEERVRRPEEAIRWVTWRSSATRRARRRPLPPSR
jgi:hypothetical protein